MTLENIKHFDTRLNDWIYLDRNNPDSIINEKLENSLLELYLPNQEFSFGHIDEKSTAQDLYNHPEGHQLLLSSKTRLLYGSPECLETIEKLCPDRKDRGAYGSIFLGSCAKAVQREMNILVVEDGTGENGGILEDGIAWRQVGDCHGKISPELAQELSNSVEQVIQFRLGIPEEYRFGKGTLAPKALDQLPFKEKGTQIDLIVPTSSFKGGDKKNNPIKPGLHKVEVWIGAKELSKQGTIALSQVHASFPTGIKDYLWKLDEKGERLQAIQNDPKALAKYYCEKYEKRVAFTERSLHPNITPSENVEENDYESGDEKSDEIIYRLLKADLEKGHGQILETQKVIDELKRFLQREWKEIAIGKAITFDRGMIIPSKDLKNGEIFVSWMDEGKEVLNFRSPLLNSNGMCVSNNKMVDDALAPNGKFLQGVIVVNDEDHKRIQARLEALEAQGIKTTEIVPLETESERQGRDYDGDCIGVALAKDFPNLTAEAKLRNQPENAYAPIKKEAKASFYREDGTQPDFEEIAMFMSDSISVGVINNHATSLEALESEIDLLKEYGSQGEREDYVKAIALHYQTLLSERKPISPQYQPRLEAIVEIASLPPQLQTLETTLKAMEINRSIYHDMVGEAGYQNQIAVDIFKSNRAPDMSVIKENQRLLHRIPNYIRDKKKAGVYQFAPLEAKGLSPVELMIRQANNYYQQSNLIARPNEQFHDLFPEIYTPTQYNQVLAQKAEFEKAWGQAVIQAQKLKHEQGPILKITTQNGNELEITNLNRYNHPLAFSAETLDIKLAPNKANHPYHKLAALAATGEVDESGKPIYKTLGTVCEVSRQQLGLKEWNESKGVKAILAAPLTRREVSNLFSEVYQISDRFRESIAPEERQIYAAAAWHSSTNRSGIKDKNTKVSNFVYATFPDEIVEQLKELQFTEFTTGGINKFNQCPEHLWRSPHQLDFEIKLDEVDGQPTKLWYIRDPETETSYPLATVNEQGGQLPVGTKVKGQITGGVTATATLNLPNLTKPITFGKVNEGEFSDRSFFNTPIRAKLKKLPPHAQPVLKYDGKILGHLDAKSIEILQQANRLREGVKLNVTLQTLGSEQGTHTLATTQQGNTVRVIQQHLYKDGKERRFNGEQGVIEVSFEQQKERMGIFLDDEEEWKLAGYFTNHSTSKDSETTLKASGLYRDGQILNGIITSNLSVAKIAIFPETIEYPKEWIKPPETIPLPPEKTTLQETQDRFIFNLTKQPTLLHRLEREWDLEGGKESLPSLGLSVDYRLSEVVHNWLQAQNIPHIQVNPNDPSVKNETKRGYALFYMVESKVPDPIRLALEKSTGGVLERNLLNFNSPYSRKLTTQRRVKKSAIKQLKDSQPLEYDPHSISPSPQEAIPSPQEVNPSTRSPEQETSEIPSPETSAPNPELLQSERTLIILPIIKSFLDLKESEHFQGEVFTATHNRKTGILTLKDTQSQVTLATAQLKDGEVIPLPVSLTDPSQPNLTPDIVNHFTQAIAPKVQQEYDKRKQFYAQRYSFIQDNLLAVTHYQPTPHELDRAVAIAVLLETGNPKEAARTVAQGKTIQDWKAQLGEKEFTQKLYDYTQKILTEAVDKLKAQDTEKKLVSSQYYHNSSELE